MATSQNGWTANDVSLTQNYTIGNGRQIRLRKGDAGYLLKTFADWFDKNIEDVDQGPVDEWGYAERTIRGSSTDLSNHASGTAMDLNATKHPLGARGTFPAAKNRAIRQHLDVVYGGVIRWGGDYVKRADEMHFEINANALAVTKVAAKLREAAKPVAITKPKPLVPTLLDLTIALERLSAASKSDHAKGLYDEARDLIGTLVSSNLRNRVPTTTADIVTVLEAKADDTVGATNARLAAAARLLKPLT